MKNASYIRQRPQQTDHKSGQRTPARPKGMVIAPPADGVEVVDHQPTQKAAPTVEHVESGWHAANQTGLPDNLKAGIEALSGLAMDDVKVHYNSPKPAQLQALAYTQGTNIHVSPGQQSCLPHEAWHVVQQKQDRVKPTLQLRDMVINDNATLEREADVMGTKAAQMTSKSLVKRIRSQKQFMTSELTKLSQPKKKTARGGKSRLQITGKGPDQPPIQRLIRSIDPTVGAAEYRLGEHDVVKSYKVRVNVDGDTNVNDVKLERKVSAWYKRYDKFNKTLRWAQTNGGTQVTYDGARCTSLTGQLFKHEKPGIPLGYGPQQVDGPPEQGKWPVARNANANYVEVDDRPGFGGIPDFFGTPAEFHAKFEFSASDLGQPGLPAKTKKTEVHISSAEVDAVIPSKELLENEKQQSQRRLKGLIE
jgi:hypothetical protein